jgi:hypothetical protein
MIEPLGYTPKPQPPLVPGPLTPEMAPLGPPDSLSLSANAPSAFQCENCPPENAWYASVGAQGLQRNRLGHVQTAFLEPTNRKVEDIPNPLTVTPVENFNSIRPPMNFGPRLTIGYLEGNQAWEVSGYFIPEQERSINVINQGRLIVPFPSPRQGVPLGFEGDNGMWNHADQVRTFYNNQLANAEFNYRLANPAFNYVELILGVRYFNLRETAGIFTFDDLFVVNDLGQPDPRRSATYTAITNNNLITGQFGGEFSAPCPIPYLGWIWFTGIGKAGLGPNFIERTFRLVRGDGLTGFRVNRWGTNFGQIYELGGYLDFHILERVRFRLGYQAIWLVGVSDAEGQVNFDLRHPAGRGLGYSSELYHGPTIEVQFLF